MPTPIGHTLAGLTVWAITRKPASVKEALSKESLGWAALCVVAANIPDADFIMVSGDGVRLSGLYHHGITHSAGFAAAMALVAGAWAWLRGRGGAEGSGLPRPAMVFLVTFFCVMSHSFLDLFGIDTYPDNGIGLPILWPMTPEYYVVPAFEGIDRTNPFTMKMVTTVSRELMMLGAPLAAALAAGSLMKRRPEEAPAVAETEPSGD